MSKSREKYEDINSHQICSLTINQPESVTRRGRRAAGSRCCDNKATVSKSGLTASAKVTFTLAKSPYDSLHLFF